MVDFKTKPSRANLQVETGDIIFAKMQGTKKTLQIDDELSNKIYSTGFCAVRPKNGIITEKCLYYLLNSSLFLKEKDKNCSGATQKAINSAGFKNIKLNVPDFSFQKDIENQLDILAEAINSKQIELQKLDGLIKARFVEMFGDYKNGINGNTVKLGDICTTCSGGTPTTKRPEYYTGTIPWISSPFLGDDYIDGKNAKAYITNEAIENSATHLIPSDTLLFAIRISVGKTSIIRESMCTNQDVVALLNVDKTKYDLLFLKHTIDAYQEHFDRLKKGATIQGITTNDLKQIDIPDANIKLQRQFATFVKRVNKSKFAVQESLEKTQLLFDSLMQKYFG